MKSVPLIKEKLIDTLRAELLSKRSNQLVRIAPERSLSETLGVSRASLRSAIDELTREGLLLRIQGKGTYITPYVAYNSLHIAYPKDLKYNDPFYNKFIVEITNLSAKRSIGIKIIDIDSLENTIQDSPLIIMGQIDNSIIKSLKNNYSKIVAIEDYPENEGLYQVLFDDYKIGADAALKLCQLSHKKVLHLAGPEKYPSSFKRKNGFIDTAKLKGMESKVIFSKMNWSGGYDISKEIAEMHKTCGFTAVFCANDWMAAGLIQGLKEWGVNTPTDISIIGCDNIPLSSEIRPNISTFDIEMQYLIEEVFEEINKQDTVVPKNPVKLLIPANFISRDSIKEI